MDIHFPHGHGPSLGGSNPSWPAPDNYNQGFTQLSDYTNYIYTQFQKFPTNWHDYQTWIQSYPNKVILADIVDAAGFLIRNGSPYYSTENQIQTAAQNLETDAPKEADYNNLCTGMLSLSLEPDNYDAGWTTAEQYMHFLDGTSIPQDLGWIQSHRQTIADLIDASNKLINKYKSPHTPFLQKLISDLDALFSPQVQLSNLETVSLDLQNYHYDEGFTTAAQYMNYLNGLTVPQNDPDFQAWIQSHETLLYIIQDAAQKLISKFSSPCSPFLQRLIKDVQALGNSTVKESDLTKVALDLKYYNYNANFTSDADYENYLKNLVSLFPTGYNPPDFATWIQNNGIILAIIQDAATRLNGHSNVDANWQECINFAYYLTLPNANGVELSSLSSLLQGINDTTYGNPHFSSYEDGYFYLMNMVNQGLFKINYSDPKAFQAWISNPQNRILVADVLNAANRMSALFGDPYHICDRIIANAENLLAPNATPSSLMAIESDIQGLLPPS